MAQFFFSLSLTTHRPPCRWTDSHNPLSLYADGAFDEADDAVEKAEKEDDFGIVKAMGLVEDDSAEDDADATLADTAERLKYEYRPELTLEVDEEGRIVGPNPLLDEDLEEVDWFAEVEREEEEGEEEREGEEGGEDEEGDDKKW